MKQRMAHRRLAKSVRTGRGESGLARAQLALGYTMVAVSVLLGCWMSLRPQAFGMTSYNPAIPVGLAVLAAFRLVALRREVRRQAEEAPAGKKLRG